MPIWVFEGRLYLSRRTNMWPSRKKWSLPAPRRLKQREGSSTKHTDGQFFRKHFHMKRRLINTPKRLLFLTILKSNCLIFRYFLFRKVPAGMQVVTISWIRGCTNELGSRDYEFMKNIRNFPKVCFFSTLLWLTILHLLPFILRKNFKWTANIGA